jgi:hypothetical protein
MRRLLLILVIIVACSLSLHAQQNQVLSAAASSCTSTNASCLIYGIDQSAGGAVITVTANASGNSLVFEASGDNGKSWGSITSVQNSNSSSTQASSTTGTGWWQFNTAALTLIRVRMSTLVGGTSTVSIITSIASARSNGGGGGGGTVTSVTGSAPIVSSGGTTPAISCPTCATVTGTPSSSQLASFSGPSSITGSSAITTPAPGEILLTNGQSIELVATPTSNGLVSSVSSAIVFDRGGTSAIELATPGPVKVGCTLSVCTGGGGDGVLQFIGVTSGTASIGVPNAAGTPNQINLPTTTGTSGQVLQTDGNNPQQSSWVSIGATNCPTCVLTGQTNVYGAFLQDFTAATMEVPEGAGFTTNVNSTIGNDTTNNNIHLWVNSADSLAAAEASAITANTIPKATNSTQSLLTASSLKDNGTTVTTTEPVGIGATPPTACGSATSCLALTEASTAGTPTAGQDYIRADSTAHSLLCSLNNGAEASCGTTLCPTCVTSAAALTNNALMTGAGLQASKTPVAGLVVNAATTGVTNTANTGPGIIFNAVGNGILSEANGIFGITNGTAGGSGTIFGTISLIGTNDNVVDIIPPASTAWAIIRQRHTIGQTGAGLALMTQDAVPISFRPNSTESFQLPSAGGAVVKTGSMTSPLYATTTNCSSSASPAVCAAAPAGSVVIAAATTTITVNTTAVTANSQIFLLADDTLGTKLSVTCNSTLATLIGGLAVTARTGGTSFQITSGATPAVNPLCISYWIVN